jgi:hypothetical protein
MGKKLRSGSEMNISDHTSESLKPIFWVKKTYILSRGSESGIRNLFDPESGVENFGSRINIPNPKHCKHVTLNSTSISHPLTLYSS